MPKSSPEGKGAAGGSSNNPLEALLLRVLKSNEQLLKSQAEEIKVLKSMVKTSQPVYSDGDPAITAVAMADCKSLDHLMDTFSYEPDNGLNFEAWFERYADIFREDAASLGEKGRVGLLLMKLETTANERFRNSILPRKPADLGFDKTVKLLTTLFKKWTSLLKTRWACLQVERNPGEEVTAYGARVNKLTEDFKLKDLSSDQFKVLIFLLGMRDSSDKSIRTRSHIQDKSPETEQNKVTLQSMIEEAERILQIEDDAQIGSAPEAVLAISNPFKKKPDHRDKQRKSQPNSKHSIPKSAGKQQVVKTPCWHCGGIHLNINCDCEREPFLCTAPRDRCRTM